MAIETPRAEGPMGSRALFAHLRDHPEARFRPVQELARQFQVPNEFVEEILTKSVPLVQVRSKFSDQIFSEIYLVRRKLKTMGEDALKHPITFVVASTTGAEILMLMLSLAMGHSLVNLSNPGTAVPVLSGPGIFIPATIVVAQMILFYRKGVVRLALYGALAYWLTGAFGLTWLEWIQTFGLPTIQRLDLILVIVLAHLGISLAYAAAGAFVALIGEYQKVLRENRRIERMSRQELLERLFQLQARMEHCGDQPQTKLNRRKLTKFLRPRLFVSAAILGFVIQTLSSLALGPKLVHLFSVASQFSPRAAEVLVGFSVEVFVYVANFWLAFISQNLKSALVVGLVYGLAGICARLLWLQQISVGVHRSIPIETEMLFIALPAIGIAMVAGIFATIQNSALEELDIQRNDEAALIAEQLKIQWRLAENTSSTTVLVVDVVRSTQMKEGADPLVVEFSFRRLQQWFEEIAVSHGGAVRSTAGDSAIIAFPNAHNAYLAATEIQRRMPTFNSEMNRLSMPFRVRCGLHVGEVQGDLGKIQFAQVIDIAAHMQKLAPAGGIAATLEVVNLLDPSKFVPLAIKSDGHDVFLAWDPNGL